MDWYTYIECTGDGYEYGRLFFTKFPSSRACCVNRQSTTTMESIMLHVSRVQIALTDAELISHSGTCRSVSRVNRPGDIE